MQNHFYCVIMAGGSGTRFWPASRNSHPKQFLNINENEKTFLRLTYERYAKIIPEENIIVVTHVNYKKFIKDILPEMPEENILLEPYSRNTSPCITYATYYLLKKDPEAIMITAPSDHLIPDEEMFYLYLQKAMEYVKTNNVLMTLGIVPTRPDANFGYIQATGGRIKVGNNNPVKVKTFTEKPSKDLAEVFIKTGEFFWNTGIYVSRADLMKEELEKYLPEVTSLFKGWQTALCSEMERDFLETAYSDCTNLSIDYGVMEKTDKAWLYPVDFRWSDIGTWESYYRCFPNKDENSNAVKAKNIITKNSSHNVIITKNPKKLIAIEGLENYVVIDTGDVLMICPNDEKRLKSLTTELGMPKYNKFR